MDEIEKKNREALQRMAAGHPIREELIVQPGDELKPANTVGNFFMEAVGAPKSWMTTLAEDKLGQQGLPQMMGSGTAGRTGNVVQGNLGAIMQKAAQGGKLSTAEQLAIKAYQGGQGTVHNVTGIAPNTAGRVAVKGYAGGGTVTPMEDGMVYVDAPIMGSAIPDESGMIQVDAPIIGADQPLEANPFVKPASGWYVPGPPGSPNPTQVMPEMPQNYNVQPAAEQPQQQAMPQSNLMAQGAQNQIAGLQKQANAESTQAKAEAAAAEQKASDAKKLEDQFQANLKHLNEQRAALFKDVQDGQIDPNRYKNSLGTGGKISSAIGIFLSGLGQGLRGKDGNPALDYFQKQIENDIEAQKATMGNKQNLLAAMDREFGNMQDATNAMRVIYADQYAADVAKAAAKSKDPAAQGRAQQLIGQIEAQYGPLMQQMAIRQTVMQGGKAGMIAPETQIQALVPKEMQPKAYEQMTQYQAALKASTDIKKVASEIGKLNTVGNRLMKPIQSKSQVDALNFQILTVAKPLLGALSDSERAAVQDSLSINMLDDAATIKLKMRNIEDLARKGATPPTWLKAYGVQLPELPQSSAPTPISKPANYGR